MDYFIFLVIVVLISMGFRVIKPLLLGVVEEKKVSLRLFLNHTKEDRVLNNLLLRKDGKSSQIDHLVISRYGIFIIETKNYSGWIYGSEGSDYWTKIVFNRKYQFRNPIKQNWSHIYMLKDILKAFRGIKYYSIVVFSRHVKLKVIESNIPVVYENELNEVINNIKECGTICIDNVENIEGVIKLHTVKKFRDRLAHVNQIKNNVRLNNDAEDQGICPKCGKILIARNGRYGQFWGCSGYPRCKYTKKFY